MTDEGCKPIAEIVFQKCLEMRLFSFMGNLSFLISCGRNVFPNLLFFLVAGNPIGDAGAETLALGLREYCPNLKTINLPCKQKLFQKFFCLC